MIEYIRGLDIADGSSIRMDCPECKGRKTFTVTNNNGQLLWNCYKASCNVSGAHKMSMSAESIYRRLNMTEDNKITDFCMPVNIVPLSSEYEQAMAWAFGWGLSPNRHGLMYDMEDCISAAVVGDDRHTGVALMGTSMSNEQKQYLSQFSTALVALDRDAVSKALQLTRELHGVVDKVKVLMLKDDLKYGNDRDIELLNMA